MLNPLLSHPSIILSPQAQRQGMEVFFLKGFESISWPHMQLRALLSCLNVANGMYLALLAERLSIGRHEARILEILKEQGSLSTGEISAQVSLSSGGVTAVLDRLVKMTWAYRYADPLDRRRICVKLPAERKEELALISKQLFEDALSKQTRLSELLRGQFPEWLQSVHQQAQSA